MVQRPLNGQEYERPDPRLVAARMGEMLSMGLDGKSARVWILSVLQGEPLFSGGKLNMEYDQFGVLTERMLGYHVEDVEIFYLYHFSRENNPCSPDD